MASNDEKGSSLPNGVADRIAELSQRWAKYTLDVMTVRKRPIPQNSKVGAVGAGSKSEIYPGT